MTEAELLEKLAAEIRAFVSEFPNREWLIGADVDLAPRLLALFQKYADARVGARLLLKARREEAERCLGMDDQELIERLAELDRAIAEKEKDATQA